ncbi:YheC/YheD family protein [Anaerobacillus sp. MEB173]|uniref:YheC/YheD family endospore coat-associated protein n=1 Tax=Anaerobacillus sp. MEB173 TaxID=3383345 RepID=UPI003F9196E2
MNIKWISTNEVDKIYFPKKFPSPELISVETIRFHFGSWSRDLSVKFTEDLPEDTIGFSKNIKDDVFIPDDLFYEINILDDQVSLGPVILYLVSNRLIVERLDKLKERIENYIPLTGLIFLSTVSGINTEKQTIKGYYFQPRTTMKEANWKEGTFRYPGAIFKRVPVPVDIGEHLFQMTNGRIFNSNHFNKWKMWEWIAPDTFIRNHLPYTQELNTLNQIYHFLDRYQSVYLKPKNGSGGKGIIHVHSDGQLYQITENTNKITMVEKLDQHPEINSIFKSENQYIIQQGVPLIHESRNVDFRIYMQKDETQQWKCSGLIARFAKPGSVTTNLQNLDYLRQGKEALKELFELDQDKVEQLEQKIVNICIHACELLDPHGCFGDIAIDFILDHHLHVWILEMNKRYGYKSFSIISDLELYRNIIRNPFLYARALAGFPHVLGK